MNDTSLTYFYDALIAARSIQGFCSDKSFENYCSDDLLASAVERKFEIIGESLNRVKRTNAADLNVISEWPAIIGFRNILAHTYDHVEDTVIWGIVSEQLPKFISELEAIPKIEG